MELALVPPSLKDYTLSDALKEKLFAEWSWFWEQAEALGFDPVEHRVLMIDRNQGDELAYAAHDWVLTRNHDGAGFWDGDWQEPYATELTKLCHAQGEIEYVENDETKELEPYG